MLQTQRAFVIGGTGFLGYHAIQELLAKGWGVTALGLPPAPPADLYPAAVRLVLCDLEHTSNEELLALLRGHSVLVYAAGLDDRVTPKTPAYPAFHHANVEMPVRVLRLARKAGVRRAIVLGSYFAHFARIWPEMKLAERHPYIRSRIEQERAVLSMPGMDVDVLELPYIFGTIPVSGWKPLWRPLVNYLRATPLVFYMGGGTACVSARTVGRAIVATIEHGHAGTCYPIGDENLTWTEMLTRLGAADERKVRVARLPDWVLKFGLYALWLFHKMQGRESGLDPRAFAPLQTARTFLDPEPSRQALRYETESLDEAFRTTVQACKP